MKNIIKVILVIIGATIGAGFASGREIFIFFNQYGTKGIYGIILSSILTGLIIYKVNKICTNSNIKTYDDFLNNIVGRKTRIINYIINIFLLASFYIMIAGFSAYLKQQFSIPNIIGIFIICSICYITLKNNVQGIINANTILVPFIILVIFFLGFINIGNISNLDIYQTNYNGNWVLSAVLYSSYNSIMLIPILVSLKGLTDTKVKNFLISISCTLILILLALIIYFLLFMIEIDISNMEMPVVYVASMLGNTYKYIYGISVLMSIYTTAIAGGYGFLKNSAKTKKGYSYLTIFICTSSIIISRFGFANLVNLLYPIFGFLGIAQIFFILKNNKNIAN